MSDQDRYHHEVSSEQEWRESLESKFPQLRAWPGKEKNMSDAKDVDLLKINVNDHTEKKNGLSYLSWAWAWAEVLKIDPQAEWRAIEYQRADGTVVPCLHIDGGSAMVKTEVTIRGKTRSCVLPVMDHRNKAIKNPDAFAINTAITRCMTKAISMHGLGLYIYAGEDLPEGEEPPANSSEVVSVRHAVRDGIGDDLSDDTKQYLLELAHKVVEMVRAGDATKAVQMVAREKLESDQRTWLENQLDSKVRAELKKAAAEIRAAFAQQTAKEAA